MKQVLRKMIKMYSFSVMWSDFPHNELILKFTGTVYVKNIGENLYKLLV